MCNKDYIFISYLFSNIEIDIYSMYLFKGLWSCGLILVDIGFWGFGLGSYSCPHHKIEFQREEWNIGTDDNVVVDDDDV